MRRLLIAVFAVALAFGLAACGSGSGGASDGDALLMITAPTKVVVTTRPVPGLGTILVDGAGRALYMFPPDAGGKVSCTGECAGTWPPLAIATGHKPSGRGSLNRADLSTLADPNTGQRIVTYFGYPLYRYAGDVSAGTANGQALFNDGGPWYVLGPDGQPVTANPDEAQR